MKMHSYLHYRNWIGAVVLALLMLLPIRVSAEDRGFVAIMDMDMLILPGTSAYLKQTIQQASDEGAKLIVVRLDTPGGMLDTTQQMIQDIFASPVPIVIYVSPSGGTATSAGVFITMAGHIAAMAPGTSIGAAHPVTGEGADLKDDMRTKVENMTSALVRSISEQRGRNVSWAEKAVRESNSLTESEALKDKVVDMVASDIDDLLKQLKGKKVKLNSGSLTFDDLGSLPRKAFEISFKDKALNVIANPNVAALLWLGATTGIGIELYNPGAILPGVVGVICLILALAVSQIIPVNYGAVMLLVLGTAMIGAELFVTSGVLAIGGIVSLVLGTFWLIDTNQAPGMQVAMEFIIPIAAILGVLLVSLVRVIFKQRNRKAATGYDALIGQHGKALETISTRGQVQINGEIWNAVVLEGVIQKDQAVRVLGVREGMILEIGRLA